MQICKKTKYSQNMRFPGSYKLGISPGLTHFVSRGKKKPNMNEKSLGSGLEDLVDTRQRTVSHRNDEEATDKMDYVVLASREQTAGAGTEKIR